LVRGRGGNNVYIPPETSRDCEQASKKEKALIAALSRKEREEEVRDRRGFTPGVPGKKIRKDLGKRKETAPPLLAKRKDADRAPLMRSTTSENKEEERLVVHAQGGGGRRCRPSTVTEVSTKSWATKKRWYHYVSIDNKKREMKEGPVVVNYPGLR